MYSTPNVAHGINNTTQEPLIFTFVKWIPRGTQPGEVNQRRPKGHSPDEAIMGRTCGPDRCCPRSALTSA